jgi:hypothetical protein
MVLLHVSRRLADVGRARSDVDQRRNLLVVSGLRNDRTSIIVAHEHHRIRLLVEGPRGGIHIVG